MYITGEKKQAEKPISAIDLSFSCQSLKQGQPRTIQHFENESTVGIVDNEPASVTTENDLQSTITGNIPENVKDKEFFDQKKSIFCYTFISHDYSHER